MDQTQRIKTAAIAGAGIAGLSTAIALCQNGWRVLLFDQAEKLEEIGAGLQISPNGTRILKQLGVFEALKGEMVLPDTVRLMGKGGEVQFDLPIANQAVSRWGSEYIHISRHELHRVLLNRLLDLQPDALRLGSKFTAYSNEKARPKLEFTNGSKIEADIVIGADGVHSKLRAQMHPQLSPTYQGVYAWRFVVRDAELAQQFEPRAYVWPMPGKHAVLTKINGGDSLNFVGMVNSNSQLAEGWRIKGKKSDLMKDFGEIPMLREVIKKAALIHRWGLYQHLELPNWSQGLVALVGDAAHPMLPSMAQGAAQALEDAEALGYFLSEDVNSARALSQFFENRKDRVRHIQLLSAQNMNVFHKSGPAGFIRNLGLGILNVVRPELLHKRTDWVYKYQFKP